jgi:iron complex outermembrane recepter protein
LCTIPPCPAGSSNTNVFNPGKAHISGLEFDGSLRPSPFFRVDFSGAYIKSSLDELKFDITPFLPSNFNVVQFTAKIGDPLPFTPEFTGNVSATFTLPVDESLGKIELSATYRYTAAFNTVASNGNDAGNAAAALLGLAPVPVDKTTPVKQIDLNLDWRNVGGQPIDFAIFASNVTNQTTYNYIQSLYYSFGFDVRYIGQPRMYGARLKVRF